jgi:predicted nucleic-acid-binding protein
VIGIDTNVLVRFFVEDDEPQTRTAQQFVSGLTANDPGFVSTVVVAELVWVMERHLDASDAEIIAAIRHLLTTNAFVVESEQQVFLALAELSEGRARFADALISALASARGCSYTVTFDKKAARLPGFRLL